MTSVVTSTSAVVGRAAEKQIDTRMSTLELLYVLSQNYGKMPLCHHSGKLRCFIPS